MIATDASTMLKHVGSIIGNKDPGRFASTKGRDNAQAGGLHAGPLQGRNGQQVNLSVVQQVNSVVHARNAFRTERKFGQAA